MTPSQAAALSLLAATTDEELLEREDAGEVERVGREMVEGVIERARRTEK